MRPNVSLAGFTLDEEDERALAAEDLAALDAAERAKVLRRLLNLLSRVVPEDPRLVAAKARMQADMAFRDAKTAAVSQIRLSAELATALRKLEEAPPARASSGPLHPDASQPWPSFIDRFFDDRPSIGESAQASHRQAFRDLEQVIGAKALCEVTKADIKAFADFLRDKPVNRAGRTNLSRDTIVKLLQHVRSYCGWAEEAGLIGGNPAEGVRPRTETREERDGKDERRAMTTVELSRLFDSPLYTGCASPGRLTTPGPNVYRAERYWFFLLAFLTGAREEELAAAPSKLVDLNGVLCIDLTAQTKTSAGARLVPVLPELRRLGIVEWAAQQERKGRGLIQGPDAPGDWSKWSNRYLDAIGLDDPTLVTYSLRHSFRQMLRASGISDELSNKVFGHENDRAAGKTHKTTGQRYGRDLSPDEARLVVDKVRAPIPLVHLW